jgi:hypothetical protein
MMNKPEQPQIGMTFSRKLMPQIDSIENFLKHLDQQIIAHRQVKVDPRDLKSTQSEFNMDKVNQMPSRKGPSGVIISNDNYILDGHHRWLAHHRDGADISVIQVDLPILELIHTTRCMPNNVLGAVKSVVKESLAKKNTK